LVLVLVRVLALALVLVLVPVEMVLVEMVLVLGARQFASIGSFPAPAETVSNTRALGRVLYTEYLLPFELAAIILLVAIVAAIALTLRSRKETKYQDARTQVSVKASDRLKIVKGVK